MVENAPNDRDEIDKEGLQHLQAAIKELEEYEEVMREKHQTSPRYPDESHSVSILREELETVLDSLERRMVHGRGYEYSEKIEEILERRGKKN